MKDGERTFMPGGFLSLERERGPSVSLLTPRNSWSMLDIQGLKNEVDIYIYIYIYIHTIMCTRDSW